MMASGSQAIIPKARGMYAKRMNNAQYEELMRRRTVPEVAAILKKQPYFKDSLAPLSTTDPHRGQIEELLQMDVFHKYEGLVRYDYSSEGFPQYFLCECEVRELLRVLHLLSIGHGGAYLQSLPAYLAGKLRIDLYALANAKSFAEVVELCRHSPYYKLLRRLEQADPTIRNFPAIEAQLLRFAYDTTFALARKSFTGAELKNVEDLFKRQAQVYNVTLILRVKTYFNNAFTAAEIKSLLMPYTYNITKRQYEALVTAPTPEAVLAALNTSGKWKFSGPITPEEMDAEGGRVLNEYASSMLHLTTSPFAALAAFLTLAKQEVENVTNVVEGVRYGLPPEKIRMLLRFGSRK